MFKIKLNEVCFYYPRIMKSTMTIDNIAKSNNIFRGSTRNVMFKRRFDYNYCFSLMDIIDSLICRPVVNLTKKFYLVTKLICNLLNVLNNLYFCSAICD